MADLLMMDTTQKFIGDIPAFPSLDGFVSADVPPKAAHVEGAVLWESSNPDAFTVVTSPDGMHVEVVSADMPEGDPARTGTLTMTADGNTDPNVQSMITVTWDVVVTAMPAPVAAGLGSSIFGAAVPK